LVRMSSHELKGAVASVDLYRTERREIERSTKAW
jgi:hypothetical protein